MNPKMLLYGIFLGAVLISIIETIGLFVDVEITPVNEQVECGQ